ncbi:MAG: ATP-binding cassette domain-containing protein, partial [Candidatus Babeliales bacterium]
NHSLHIKTPNNQPNKLYGIIGPSGIGKTTLISILGGQLKPQSGSILINEIDIYAISDDIRRQLITLQGQVATTVKGTVRYNLLFGLPEHHDYSDEYLCDIIKRVGLDPILREHQGLDTRLGEGALNISGGQRQRLNFAALYLRARYYKPVLILIDEPTSSLDEISEQAITSMIQELASSAITLVIAHRLKTLRDAAGLIDLSLLKQSKEIKIYSSEQLKEQSIYYQKLLEEKNELA